MIPTVNDTESAVQEFTVISESSLPSQTYKMLLERERVIGRADGVVAMKQAIFKILQTERYQYSNVYSNNYGVEFWSLYGKPIVYAVPEIERRIREAVTWDKRVTSVSDFEFSSDRNVISVNFIAHTIFGDIDITDVTVEL